jgi:carbamoyl-phosphate synthase large subunit
LTDTDKKFIKELGQKFIDIGFSIVATGGTHKAFEEVGIPSTKVLKISEGRPNIADLIANNEIALVVNTSDSSATKSDAKVIRQSVLRLGIPYVTTVAAALVTADAIAAVRVKKGSLNPQAIQDYLA